MVLSGSTFMPFISSQWTSIYWLFHRLSFHSFYSYNFGMFSAAYKACPFYNLNVTWDKNANRSKSRGKTILNLFRYHILTIVSCDFMCYGYIYLFLMYVHKISRSPKNYSMQMKLCFEKITVSLLPNYHQTNIYMFETFDAINSFGNRKFYTFASIDAIGRNKPMSARVIISIRVSGLDDTRPMRFAHYMQIRHMEKVANQIRFYWFACF